MKSIKHIICCFAALCLLIAGCSAPISKPDATLTEHTMQVRFTIDESGYPIVESAQAIYDELDYQRAVMAYLWMMPTVTMHRQHMAGVFYGKQDDFDLFFQYQDPSTPGMLTPNTVVEYVTNSVNLRDTGPIVLEMPGGELVGLMMDYQMHWVADLGLVSDAGPEPEKILFLGPDHEVPDGTEGYRVERVTTDNTILAIRVLNPVRDEDLDERIKLYPWSERAAPKKNRLFQAQPGQETYLIAAPKGMEYWENVNEIIQKERVLESDLYMMDHLKALGIEKGKPFAPTEHQQRILERAAFMGEMMAATASFRPRSEASKYRDDSSWVHPLTLNYDHQLDPYTKQFEERVDWAFEAYGLSPAMQAKFPGKGSTYLAVYSDADGAWFDGGRHYSLHIAPDPPANQFWAATVYDLQTRGTLVNETGKTAVNSYTEGLQKNSDGSIDVYFGPTAPEGKEANWIQTVEGGQWFIYFRLYGPTETYFDRSWPMYDIEEIK
jgi:hypothetical protein